MYAIQVRAVLLIAAIGLLYGTDASAGDDSTSKGAEMKLVYPKTQRSDQVDNYHGVKVPDPYRWLEDVNSSATKSWIESQNKVTLQYLEQIPQRRKLQERLTKLWNYEQFGIPVSRGGRYFYTRNDGLQNQSVLFVRDGLSGAPRMLIDPNTWSADGATALAEWDP